MSVAFTIRAVLLMTVMPDADAREVLTTLLGDLVGVPWGRPHTVPSATVLSTWRAAVGAENRDDTEDNDAEHRDDAAARVGVGGGLRLGAIDGTVTRMPDTAANRAAFGTAGQAETGLPADPSPARLRRVHPGKGRGRAGAAGSDAGRAARRVGSWTVVLGPPGRSFPGSMALPAKEVGRKRH
jgi:hypothetical protein